MNLNTPFFISIMLAIMSPITAYADEIRNETYCYYSGYPMPDDMTKSNKEMCYKYWGKEGYVGGNTIISHSFSQKDLTGKKGEKLISELIQRDKQALIDLEKRLSQPQEEVNTPCNDVMHSFMRKRKYLSQPELINETQAGSVYYCVVRYMKDNVEYSLPVHVQITYNPNSGTYKYKPM